MDFAGLVRRALSARWLPLLALLVLVAALAALWRLTPAGDALEPQAMAEHLRDLGRSPWAPLLIVGLFVVANAVLVSNMALTTATILALGAMPGVIYALAGSLAAGLAGFWVGRRIGIDRLRALQLPGVDTLSRHLRRSGLLGVTMVRMLPVAPYGVVNIAMGALAVRPLWFTLGTVLGLLPTALAIGVVGDRVRKMLTEEFDAADVGIVVAIVVALVALILILKRWLARRAALDAD